MGALNLHEIARDTVKAQIVAEMPAALVDLRTDRPDDVVTTENFESFFINPEQQAYRLPALYTIAGDITRKQADGANYITATLAMDIVILVEARDTELLEIKCDRYLAAVDKTLDQQCLVSTNGNQKMFVLVRTIKKSRPYELEQNSGEFRKEAVLECDIEIHENF